MPDGFGVWIAILVLAAFIVGAAIIERIRYPDPKERHRRRQGSTDGGSGNGGSSARDAYDGADGGDGGGD